MLRKIIFCILILIDSSGFAAIEDNVLHVGVNSFVPPFVIRSGSDGYYGFDINMMMYICKDIKRTCKFHSLELDELLTSVQNARVDAAASALTITYERSQNVNFSNPYLPSFSRFLGLAKFKNEKFTPRFLAGKRIGIKESSIFDKQLAKLKLKKIKVYKYKHNSQIIEALVQGKVDLVLTDDATAVYWQNHSSDQIFVLGSPLKYGIGYGIATNLKENELTQQINMSLVKYHKSMQFKRDFDTYISSF